MVQAVHQKATQEDDIKIINEQGLAAIRQLKTYYMSKRIYIISDKIDILRCSV